MIVLDASAALEVLLRSPAGLALEARILAPEETVHAPQLIDLEVLQVLRRYAALGDLEAPRAAQVLDDLVGLPVERYAPRPFVRRIWQLRHDLTAYDAAYVALAEALSAPLLTVDERLARSTGHHATIELAPPPAAAP